MENVIENPIVADGEKAQRTRERFEKLVLVLLQDENGICEDAHTLLCEIAYDNDYFEARQNLYVADATDGRFYLS